MSFSGSVSAMLTTLKNNKIPKREKKLGRKEYVKGVPIGQPLIYKNKMRTQELELLKENMRKKKRRALRITLIVYSLSIIAVSIGVYSYFH